MGRPVYLPTWMVDSYGFHVGIYTSPMDPKGLKKRTGESLFQVIGGKGASKRNCMVWDSQGRYTIE